MDFEVDDDFKQKFQLESNKVSFKTHKQLDEFVHMLIQREPDFQYAYKYEYYMLKSFDRAFWLKYMRQAKQQQQQGNEMYEPMCDSDGVLQCAFGDPQKASILDLKLKKL